MIYAILAEAVIILALVAVIHGLARAGARERSDRAEAYERTLQTMADRVQAPDRLPARDTSMFVMPEQEPDEWAKVGQIDIDPDYGLSDATDSNAD